METSGERITYFADVVLPLPLDQYFTYRVPFEFSEEVQVGTRVIVQFGRKKIMTAIVVQKHTNPPIKHEAKYILDTIGDSPCIDPLQIPFWEWIAKYYMCSVGEVMNAAIPSGFKLTSQSRIQLNPEYNLSENQQQFTDNEWILISRLKKTDSLAYHEAAETLNVPNPYKSIKYLIAKKAILIFEEIKDKYKPKIIKKIRLHPKLSSSEESLNELLDTLNKSPKQESVLLKFLSQVGTSVTSLKGHKGLDKQQFLKEGVSISASSLNTLVKRGVFEEFETIVPRFEESFLTDSSQEISLSVQQQEAQQQILKGFEKEKTVLLHGVTGSGKTEVYITLIQQVLESGSQALLLLPEIVLTTQIVSRLKKVFGKQMGVYHSRFSDNERVEVWQAVKDGTLNFIIGVRSSVFLPFNNLGLIVVDEEHDPSYKQYDPAPRYNARDAAQVLAKQHHAKVLLGSATPSVESYYLANKGHYSLVKLEKRYGGASMPKVSLVDLRKEKKQKKMQGDFSEYVLSSIKSNIESEKQVILFQNRRGYAPYIMCEDCGEIPSCKNCAVSLTYHMYTGMLVCHYCGHKQKVTGKCGVCNSQRLQTCGLGTEKIEDELQVLFPEANIERMDLDTTRRKHSYEKILERFSNGDTQILVGTQMVSKGLDFAKVELVGIFDIDRLIYFPNFRSHERAFQLIAQVSGRAGRRGDEGEVVIQTSSPEHPLLKQIANNDYLGFFNKEIRERHAHNYPPFSRLIRITVRNPDKVLVSEQAIKLTSFFRLALGKNRVLGPESPIVDKIRNLYLKDILIKLERDKIDLYKAKQIVFQQIAKARDIKRFSKLDLVIDVDCV